MRCSLASLAALGFALVVCAEPFLTPYVVHEKRTTIPSGWTLARRHDASSTLPLRFALKQKNIQNIGDFLMDVSHPKSVHYGKHWSPAAVARKFAPGADSIHAVHEWLLASGIDAQRIRLSAPTGWIKLDVTVEEAERLMHTQYNVYKHRSGTEHIACEAYHLPEHVSNHVDFVLPTVHFDAHLRPRNHGGQIKIGSPRHGFTGLKVAGKVSDPLTQLEQCDQFTTPECLRVLYGLEYQPIATNKNSYGIVEYTPQAFVESDLQLFATNYSNDLIGKSPSVVSIDGGVLQTQLTGLHYNGESNLDLQYGMALVTGKQPVTLYQVGDTVEGASFNNFLDALDKSYCTFEGGDDPSEDGIYPDAGPGGYAGPEACGSVQPAWVISTSYGYNEADFTPFYAERQCAEYAKLGLMGVTVLFSSGDTGVAGDGLCLNPNGTQSDSGKLFNPSFPSTCPWVTAVGATMMKPNTTVTDPQPEQACDTVIYSGGGFSNYFGIPQYQKDVVDQWISKHAAFYEKEYGMVWNTTGKSRAFPDISANGANYVVAINGTFYRVFGTSASTPVVGALLTMVNDARLAQGMGPIGFINPCIYSEEFADGFTDITEGNNAGCGTNGFNATVGWDPVTGLGTPSFPKLLSNWVSGLDLSINANISVTTGLGLR